MRREDIELVLDLQNRRKKIKLALECRTDLLEQVQPFADLDFILANEVLKDSIYAEYYKKSIRVKILDNSVNEEGEPLSLDKILEASNMVGASFIVSPDFFGDADKTISNYIATVKRVGSEGVVVGVLQGEDFEDVKRCLSVYKSIVAVPFDICSKKGDTPEVMSLRRALVVKSIASSNIQWIHLLGFTSLEEVSWYEGLTSVYSIDTGAPVLLGLQSKDILDPIESKEKPTYNQMKGLKMGAKEWTYICRNIALLRKYIS